mmetsp:Transcript_31581/g.51487  ORF Transcript_31581/g.51487 Transcript_31581/m.51487 type:complete len:126 (-) Transcript_31581:113-490(-)
MTLRNGLLPADPLPQGSSAQAWGPVLGVCWCAVARPVHAPNTPRPGAVGFEQERIQQWGSVAQQYGAGEPPRGRAGAHMPIAFPPTASAARGHVWGGGDALAPNAANGGQGSWACLVGTEQEEGI